MIKSNTSETDALEVKTDADLMLERIRNFQSTDLVPRLETINEISKGFALEGSWEKAESLISNMKNECKTG